MVRCPVPSLFATATAVLARPQENSFSIDFRPVLILLRNSSYLIQLLLGRNTTVIPTLHFDPGPWTLVTRDPACSCQYVPKYEPEQPYKTLQMD